MDPVCTPNNGHAQSCFLRGESSALLLPSSFFQTPVVVSAHMQNLSFLPFFLCWINISSRPIGKTSFPQLSHYFSLLLCEQNIYWIASSTYKADCNIFIYTHTYNIYTYIYVCIDIHKSNTKPILCHILVCSLAQWYELLLVNQSFLYFTV